MKEKKLGDLGISYTVSTTSGLEDTGKLLVPLFEYGPLQLYRLLT